MFEANTPGFAKLPAAVLGEPDFAKVCDAHSLTPRCLPFEDEGRSVIVGKSY